MDISSFKRTKLACYTACFTMSSAFCLPPVLFVTFRDIYGISWTLLGTLILVNFCTQLAVDLIFTAFSRRFNIALVLKAMPVISTAGMLIYAIFPMLFSNLAYLGLLIGTVIFSISAGLSEVLLSATVAAIPSDNPQRDMGTLHGLYPFGVVFFVVISTLFIEFVGSAYWSYMTIAFALLPLISFVLFMTSPIPDVKAGEGSKSTEKSRKKTIGIFLCLGCIFFGSCAENTMSNWISSYVEAELKLPKVLGDILGVATFALLLGITRMWYARRGKNICRMLLIGMIGSSVCYLVIGLSESAAFSFIACILTGFFSAMLWPGTLIMMEENIHGVGVGAYALMAAGGDFGASLSPQLMGIIADNFGLQKGMLTCSAFPILGVILMIIIIRFFKSNSKEIKL